MFVLLHQFKLEKIKYFEINIFALQEFDNLLNYYFLLINSFVLKYLLMYSEV